MKYFQVSYTLVGDDAKYTIVAKAVNETQAIEFVRRQLIDKEHKGAKLDAMQVVESDYVYDASHAAAGQFNLDLRRLSVKTVGEKYHQVVYSHYGVLYKVGSYFDKFTNAILYKASVTKVDISDSIVSNKLYIDSWL